MVVERFLTLQVLSRHWHGTLRLAGVSWATTARPRRVGLSRCGPSARRSEQPSGPDYARNGSRPRYYRHVIRAVEDDLEAWRELWAGYLRFYRASVPGRWRSPVAGWWRATTEWSAWWQRTVVG